LALTGLEGCQPQFSIFMLKFRPELVIYALHYIDYEKKKKKEATEIFNEGIIESFAYRAGFKKDRY